jgi:hypothetical protein
MACLCRLTVPPNAGKKQAPCFASTARVPSPRLACRISLLRGAVTTNAWREGPTSSISCPVQLFMAAWPVAITSQNSSRFPSGPVPSAGSFVEIIAVPYGKSVQHELVDQASCGKLRSCTRVRFHNHLNPGRDPVPFRALFRRVHRDHHVLPCRRSPSWPCSWASVRRR